MSEEWSNYAKILEREDKEFKRPMWEEVSITLVLFYFSLNLTANNRALAAVGIFTQHEKDLSTFQVMFISYVVNVTKFTSA